MIKILLVTSILSIFFVFDNSYAAVMKFPKGTMISQGEKLEVVIELDDNEPVDSVLLQAEYFNENVYTGRNTIILKEKPYRHMFTAGFDYVGEAYVSAEVVYKNKNKKSDKLLSKVNIKLPDNIKLIKIGLDSGEGEIILNCSDYPTRLGFGGLFSDGHVRSLFDKYHITVSSDDTSIIDIEDNKLVPLKEGKTKIRVLVDNTSITFDAKVEINIPPPIRLKAKIIDKSVQLNWEQSGNESYVTSYKIFRRQSHAVYFLAEIPKGSITYIDNTAVTGGYYDYIVKAVSRILDKQSDNYVSVMIK